MASLFRIALGSFLILGTITLPVLSVDVITTPGIACPPGFYNSGSSCYAGIRVQSSWAEALRYCQEFGAQLAIISSAEEQNEVANYLKTLTQDKGYGDTDDHQYWIGAIDYTSEGDWIWAITTDKVVYGNWAPGNPDNGGDNGDDDDEHCAEMSEERNWMWNDNGCHEHKHFLCEII